MNDESDIIETEAPATAPPLFEIDSAEKANWLVRRFVECRTYKERVHAFAERERRRAEREERLLMARFAHQLERWLVQRLGRQSGRRKSVVLPAGVVRLRRVRPKLIFEDKQAVLRWAKEHVPEAVFVTERLMKAKLDEMMATTGLIPDKGARVEPGRDRLFVR